VQPSNKTFRARRRRSLTLLSWFAVAGFSLGGAKTLAQEGSVDAGQAKSLVCGACHGADGNSIADPNWPSLAGQHAAYTVRQLESYRNGERDNTGGMQGLVATLSEEDMHDVAAYFEAQALSAKGAEPTLVDRGERIYRSGIAEREIPACIACHGPQGAGNQPAGYPKVSHQHAAYLAKTLRDYRAGERRSDASLNQMMRNVAELLLDDEIEALASYMQGLY